MSGLLGAPKPPKIQPPAVMPDPNNVAAIAEKRRAAAASAQQTGRASTMLSNRPQQNTPIGR